MSEQQGFWTSLQGILTGIAAIITAFTGLYIAVFNNAESTDRGATSGADTTISSPDENGKSDHSGQEIKTPVLLAAQEGENSETLANTIYQDLPAFPKHGPLVDCKQFPTVNSVTSLMSWSNHYQMKLVQGHESKPHYSCNHAVGNRARAHCKELDNVEIRQALLESLTLCRSIGFEWNQVKPE